MPYAHLPTWGKCAVEWLDCNDDKRNAAQLDSLLEFYAKGYGVPVDDHTRESAHHICVKRFWNFQP